MLVEQALSWLGHVQNTAHSCSHDKDYTNEMDHLFQTSYHNFARMRDVCVETGVEISTLIANASTSKASWKRVQLSTHIAFTTPPLEPTCPLSVCACSDALWRMGHGSVEPCARPSSAWLQAVQHTHSHSHHVFPFVLPFFLRLAGQEARDRRALCS